MAWKVSDLFPSSETHGKDVLLPMYTLDVLYQPDARGHEVSYVNT